MDAEYSVSEEFINKTCSIHDENYKPEEEKEPDDDVKEGEEESEPDKEEETPPEEDEDTSDEDVALNTGLLGIWRWIQLRSTQGLRRI